MRLRDYLAEKDGTPEPTEMLRAEASFFGIAYPLTSGWLARNGDKAIPPDIALELADRLRVLVQRAAPEGLPAATSLWREGDAASAARGLAVLERYIQAPESIPRIYDDSAARAAEAASTLLEALSDAAENNVLHERDWAQLARMAARLIDARRTAARSKSPEAV